MSGPEICRQSGKMAFGRMAKVGKVVLSVFEHYKVYRTHGKINSS
jgi:hypothetical protein